MEDVKINDKLKNKLKEFLQELKNIYGEELISAALYGSAASGEFIEKHSNLNMLIVLRNASLENLKKSSNAVNKYPMIRPLFLTEGYIAGSTDVFPIEFLDMRENYILLYGKDVLKDVAVDTRNLRFQCEQELKAKLINLKHLYLVNNKDNGALRNLLLKSFTSILHIMRNILRLKSKTPAYKKDTLLKELAADFNIDISCWQKILLAKNRQMKLKEKEIEQLFIGFINDLERVTEAVDKL